MAATDINSSNFTAILTIIGHQKLNYFFFGLLSAV